MYRPTVRYDEVFKDYVDQIFQNTTLDRNQIIRLALFTAAHSKNFYEVLKDYQKSGDVPTPSPAWEDWEYGYWLNQSFQKREGRGDVSVKSRGTKETETIAPVARRTEKVIADRRDEQIQRREGEISSKQRIRICGQGGIKITFN